MVRLLDSDPAEDERIIAEIESRGGDGQPIFSSILYVLTHLSFSEGQARKHWERIVTHRAQMSAALGRDPGLRVALLDYFVNVGQELKNPKIIEISIYERTERSALTDGLTGLFNHAFFVQALRREVQRARRNGSKLSLVMLDLDNFKQLNDTRGHVEGDRALVKAAGLVAESLRDIDICARYGGEEFAVVLPETSVQGAFVVAERIRERIEKQFRKKRGLSVTISGGVATFPDDALDHEQLVLEADALLYRSKAEGKNRITMPDPNRRRHERLPFTHPVELAVGGSRTIEGMTRDVSEGGVLLESPEPLPVGRQIGLVLRPENAPPLNLRGHVVRTAIVPVTERPYEVGLRLVSDARRNRELVLLPRSNHAGH
jgi:diguanylate cyclase (GGDEF)-like protein